MILRRLSCGAAVLGAGKEAGAGAGRRQGVGTGEGGRGTKQEADEGARGLVGSHGGRTAALAGEQFTRE